MTHIIIFDIASVDSQHVDLPRYYILTAKMQISPKLPRIAASIARSNLQYPRPLSTSSILCSTTKPGSDASGQSRNTSAPQNRQNQQKDSPSQQDRNKTVAELDEELREKLEGMSGEGGASGIELEDGKPVAMKRGVRDNMFRYI